jgi:hypothetical protein
VLKSCPLLRVSPVMHPRFAMHIRVLDALNEPLHETTML